MQGVIFLDLTNKELIDLIKNNIDTINNFERLYKQNTGFIFQTIRSKAHGIYDVDDLMQEAYLALVKTVEIYDNSREDANFLQVLKWCILNRVRNLNTCIPSHIRSLITKYKIIHNKLNQEHGYEPDDDEIMTLMNIDYKKLIQIKQNLYECISLDGFLNDEKTNTRIVMLEDENAHLIAQCNLEIEDMKNKIHEAVSMLPHVMQYIIYEIYINQNSYLDISEKLGMSYSRVVGEEKRALRLLRANKKFLKSVSGYVNNDNDEIDGYSKKSVEAIVVINDTLGIKKKELMK
jgi:RNA polymerase sigma factor (sigma-70 family)